MTEPAPGPGISPEEQAERKERIKRLKQELVGDLLTTAEVAEILEIHPRTVGEYIRDGRLPAINLGGGWKVSEEDLRYFVQEIRPTVAKPATRLGKPWALRFEPLLRGTMQIPGQGSDLHERFVALTRKVIVEAQTAARSLNHNYLGTEHLLMGLLATEDPLRQVLSEAGLGPDEVRAQIVDLIGTGATTPSGNIPFTPRAKKALERAMREASRLGQDAIRPEHLLLSMLTIEGSVGQTVIARLTGDPLALKERVLALLEPPGDEPAGHENP